MRARCPCQQGSSSAHLQQALKVLHLGARCIPELTRGGVEVTPPTAHVIQRTPAHLLGRRVAWVPEWRGAAQEPWRQLSSVARPGAQTAHKQGTNRSVAGSLERGATVATKMLGAAPVSRLSPSRSMA